jgi:hypothetical protein
VKERRHQPFWDSMIRTTGNPTPTIQQSSRLFGNANIGRLDLTNLQVAGQLASDQTYVILALRCWLFFDGTNARANYLNIAAQLYFTLTMGDKPAFQAPCWYYPSGGGIWGSSNAAADPIYNLGMPTHESILKLARPIMVPVRQNFAVEAQFFTVGSTNGLTLLNSGAQDDQKVIMFVIDGLQTRDVQ